MFAGRDMRRGWNDCGEVVIENAVKRWVENDEAPGGHLCPEQGRIGFTTLTFPGHREQDDGHFSHPLPTDY